MYPYESSCAVLWWYAALVSHVWQSWVSLEILLCSMLEGVWVWNGMVGSLTEEVLRLLRHKRCGTMFDFQTGGPTVSPLLLIYMCWKSNLTFMERTILCC